MKRFLKLITVLFLTFTLYGCDTTKVEDNNPNEQIFNIEEVHEVEVLDTSFDILERVSFNDESYSLDDVTVNYNDFDIRSLGEYSVDISIETDKETITKSVTITVVDSTAPRVSLRGELIVTVSLGSNYEEAGVELSDNYDFNLSLITIGQVDTSKVGDYTLEYKTIDSSGNVSRSVYRTITVVDHQVAEIDEFGLYISRDEVALYIYTYHKLPSNYMTKSEAGSHISNYWTSTNMASIGGDRFYNREGLLPESSGRYYYEVDINYRGGSRGAERIVYSSDGFIFYTSDHYDSFKLYNPETKGWDNYSKYDDIFNN